MKKIRFLSLLIAMVISVSLCLAACNNGTVGEHDHEWDDGEVTTQPTCHSEGVMTYSCKVEGCKQTQTAPIQMTEHSWDQGEVSRAPKCNDAGEKTYNCTAEGCTATKKEPVGKTEHRWDDGVITKPSEFSSAGVRTYTCQDCDATREVSIDAHADFVEQFYTDQENKTDWSYGAATAFDATTGNIEFAAATVDNNVWKAAGVEIGSGVVKVTSAKVAIAYNFTDDLPKLVKATFNVSFKGGVVKAYIVVVSNETTVITLNNESKAEWTYINEKAVDVVKGNTVYLILEAEAAIEGVLSFTVYAPCLHVWDQGTVTTEPKCNIEGVKEFKCVSCDEKYTQFIDKLPHEWNDGEVTTEPTEDSEGVKTFTCKNCSETRTESIPKLEVENLIADFGRDFAATLAGESNWTVSRVDYHWSTETFDCTALEADLDAFKNNPPWMEVKGDWMAINDMVGFAYHFQSAASVNFKFVLHTDGNFSVRWALKDSNGVIKTNDGKASWGGIGKDVTVAEDLTVAAGDVLYLLIQKEGDSATDQCTFSLKLTGEELVQFDGANFGEEFELTLAGESNWEVGVVNYHWDGTETFDFTAIKTLNNAGNALINDNPWMEIKGDWMAANGMMGFAYHFDVAATVSFNFVINCADNGKCSLRWALMGSDGVIKTNDGKASWGGDGKDVTLNEDITVANGDVLYILVNKEGDSDQSTFSLEIAPKGQTQPEQPAESFNGANFGEKFESTLAGESNWEVGSIDYHWSSETFDFTKLLADAEAFKNNDPWMEVKGDWMAINAMVGLAYHFDSTARVNFNFALNSVDDGGKFSVRWALKDKNGNIKTNDGKASWGDAGKDVTVTEDLIVEEGDVLFILIQKEDESSTNQCTFSLVLTQKQ